eukprot:maker-scaffold405_size181423-snap-gene-0.40 protein:Tk08186 transcript:maker-scaffold405_size181423-snap-gene-0.40-mRNA-1 annotation:"hypothetical protein EAI_00434"
MSLRPFVSEVKFHAHHQPKDVLEGGDTPVRIERYRRRGSDDLVREDGASTASTAHTTLSSAPSSSFKTNKERPRRLPNYLAEDAIQREHELLQAVRVLPEDPEAIESSRSTPENVVVYESLEMRSRHDNISLLITGDCPECGQDLTSVTSNNSMSDGAERLRSHFDPHNWMLGAPPTASKTGSGRCHGLSSALRGINQSLTGAQTHNISLKVESEGNHFYQPRLVTPKPPLDMGPERAGETGDSNRSLPKYIQNIIVHQQMHTPKPHQNDTKMMKKLSKQIVLPDDPSDPAAFTVTPGITRPAKPPWCSSKPVLKIVGTFAFMMSLGIILAIVYMNWFSDMFRPMDM